MKIPCFWCVNTVAALVCVGALAGAGQAHAAPPAADAGVFLPHAARQLDLPRMDEAQIKDFINDVVQELELTRNYRRADAQAPKLPERSEKIREGATLVRKTGAGVDVLQFGYVIAPRRAAKLAVYGVSIGPTGVEANPDVKEAALDPVLKRLLKEAAKVHSKLRLSDLQSTVINLSYVDADSALLALRAMGFSAVTDDGGLAPDDSEKELDVPLLADPVKPKAPAAAAGAIAGLPGAPPVEEEEFIFSLPKTLSFSFDMPVMLPGDDAKAPTPPKGSPPPPPKPGATAGPAKAPPPTSIDFDRLPLVFKMPSADPKEAGLVGFDVSGMAGNVNALGLSMMPSAASPLGQTIAAPTVRLLVLTHPQAPAQLERIRRVLEEVIDKPARQVFVEGLVLEVSRQSIAELGVQWQNKGGKNALQLGSLVQLTPNTGQAALQLVHDSAAAVDPRQFLAKINALVDSNKAEILSRPSVLTLDNRQATIRVGTDIPIATSKDASSGAGSGRVAFSFQYLPTGILLNVRPRVSQEGREISMLIDATVSAVVPGHDLRTVDPATGVTMASAPTISTRRVQTYARIQNNTPLIIGGLVSRDQSDLGDKVPGLGDIPFLGKLFGYESKADARREVIIVLTPSVLTEELRATKPQLPKDDERFDLVGTSLFRESHRILAEDLIDSQYIRFNQRLLSYRAIVNKVTARVPSLASVKPFSNFSANRVPGEFIFVSGMMGGLLKRVDAGKDVNIDRLNFLEGVIGADFKTESVGGLLKRLGDGTTHQGFFEKNPGKALTLRFLFGRNSAAAGRWASEPQAEVAVVDCPDRTAWRKLLWDLNQPVDGVQQHYTLVIQDASDLERLKLAIALKNTILANGNEASTIFDNFLPGRMLAMQAVSPTWGRMLEGTVARYFYYSELYYPAFTDAMERAFQELDAALRKPEMAKYLDGIVLP
jgi:general secretion pathway protein D